MNKYDLNKEQLKQAHELHDEDPDAFDVWMIGYIQNLPASSTMKYQDFVYTYYLEKTRINKINDLLDE